MVHKFRKTVSALCKLRSVSDQKANQKVMEGRFSLTWCGFKKKASALLS